MPVRAVEPAEQRGLELEQGPGLEPEWGRAQVPVPVSGSERETFADEVQRTEPQAAYRPFSGVTGPSGRVAPGRGAERLLGVGRWELGAVVREPEVPVAQLAGAPDGLAYPGLADAAARQAVPPVPEQMGGRVRQGALRAAPLPAGAAPCGAEERRERRPAVGHGERPVLPGRLHPPRVADADGALPRRPVRPDRRPADARGAAARLLLFSVLVLSAGAFAAARLHRRGKPGRRRFQARPAAVEQRRLPIRT